MENTNIDVIDEIENDINECEPLASYKIMNLEGAWFDFEKEQRAFSFDSKADRKYTNRDGKEITIKANDNKLFSVVMPYSIETIRAFEKLPDEIITINGDDLATKLFVNFKFSKDLFDDNEIDDKSTKISKKRLRKLVYTSTVKIDGIDYCYFKRGASKARTSNVIFCKKDHYDKLYTPCLLGLKFIEDEEYDITSKEAYVSLIMSGIIGTLNIKSDEILIVNDLMSPSFKAKQSVTTMDKKGNISQDIIDENDVINNCTDGEALMDESIFLENKILNKATTALLRNDFLKANTVRTRLQDYYKENKITQVWDMFRGWIDASKIKLVITNSSCKYLKFKDQFDSEKDCFLDWLKRIPQMYGIVKIDHVGQYSYSNRLSYQMWNSMNLDKPTVKSIMQNELDYYKLLKDNNFATSADIKKMSKKEKGENRKIRNEMTYFLDLVNSNKKENNDYISSGDMIADLLNTNSDFRLTDEFKNWKKEQLKDYVANLRLGKVRIQNSIYAIMVSCPYEFLVSTTKKDNKVDNCIMNGWECWCPNFKNNSSLLAIRNPQINAGNIAKFTNKWHYEYRWFGYNVKKENEIKETPAYNFVIFVNSYNNADVMNRLQGCDWDVDSCYLTDQSELVLKAEESKQWATPVNKIKGTKEYKKYNNKSLADLDNFLGTSTLTIGKIVNKSAVFNGYMYHAINNGYSQKYIDACYKASSTLSSFSQIAIDMAKNSFKGLNLTTQMNKLNQTTFENENKEQEQILQFKFDMDNLDEIDLIDYVNECVSVKANSKYEIKYLLPEGESIEDLDYLVNLLSADKNDENKAKLSEKDILRLYEKIKVHKIKMVVPLFFKYTAKDNSYRIPTKMDCSMDYLEEILDELDTKAIQTDIIKIQDLLVMQKDLEGRAFSRNKIDKVRNIIDKCQSTLDNNYYDKLDDEEETKQKANLRKWAKKQAVNELKELKLNEKTVYRILLRAFNLDKDYKRKTLYKYDKDGDIISYFDYDEDEKFVLTVKELKEMSTLVLTLLHKSYTDSFLKCFIKKEIKKVGIKRYWK